MKVYEQNVNFKENIAGKDKKECDIRTPYCIYNNEINDIDKYNEFKIFKIKKNTKYYENYFKEKFFNKDKKQLYNEEEKSNNINNINNFNNNIENDVNLNDFDNILLERHKHVCTQKLDNS